MTRKIVKRVTNGLEILEKTDEPGTYIPIIPVIGKELYLTEGGKTVRKLMSLIRLARDPYMLFCYLDFTGSRRGQLSPKAPIRATWGSLRRTRKLGARYNKIATQLPADRPDY